MITVRSADRPCYKIMIMGICRAPTPPLKALNKHYTYNVQRNGQCYPQFNQKLTHNVDKGSSITTSKMHTHARTHARTHALIRGERQCCLAEYFQKRNVLSLLLKEERVARCLGERLLYFWWSLCTLYLHASRSSVTVGDSGLCCTCVTYFER